jgi:hypothetical protein
MCHNAGGRLALRTGNRANQGAVNDCAWEQMIGKQISPIIASASEGARAEL